MSQFSDLFNVGCEFAGGSTLPVLAHATDEGVPISLITTSQFHDERFRFRIGNFS